MKFCVAIVITLISYGLRAQVMPSMDLVPIAPLRVMEANCELPLVLPELRLPQLATSCFEHRQWHGQTTASDDELLTQDLQACRCLREEPPPLLHSGYSPLEGAALRLQEVSSIAALQSANLSASRNGLLLNAHLLKTNGDREADLANIYGQNRLNRLFEPGGRRSFFEKRLRDFHHKANRYVDRRADYGEQLDRLARIESPALDRSLLEAPRATGPQQCVGSKEYLGFRKVPASNAFYQDLSALGERFVEADWNTKELNRRIDRLPANSEERNRLEARLQFLNRNPLIKNLFAADWSTNIDFLSRSLPGWEESSEVMLSRHWRNLDRRKEDLFKLVKTLGQNTCGEDAGKCQVSLYENGAYKSFQTQAELFFSNPDVAFLTSVEGEKDTLRRIEELGDFESVVPMSQEGLETLLNLTPNQGSTSECIGTDVDIEKCFRIFSKYCPIAEASQSARRDPARVRRAEQQMDLVNDNETEISKNPALAQFNREVCQTSRTSNGAPGIPAMATFWEFKAFCDEQGRSSGNRACAKTELNDLVANYLEHYPTKDHRHPPVMAEELAAEKDQHIAAFRQHLLKAPVFNLSSDQTARVAVSSGDLSLLDAAAASVNGQLLRRSYPNGGVPAHLGARTDPVYNLAASSTQVSTAARPQSTSTSEVGAQTVVPGSFGGPPRPDTWDSGATGAQSLPDLQRQREQIREGIAEAERNRTQLPPGDPRIAGLEERIRDLQTQLRRSDQTLQELLRRKASESTAPASGNPSGPAPVAASGAAVPASNLNAPTADAGFGGSIASSVAQSVTSASPPGMAQVQAPLAPPAPVVLPAQAARGPKLGSLNQGLLEAKYADASTVPPTSANASLIVTRGEREEVQQIIRLASLEDYQALAQNRMEVLSKYSNEIDFSQNPEITISASVPGQEPIYLRLARSQLDRSRTPAALATEDGARVITRDDLLRNLNLGR